MRNRKPRNQIYNYIVNTLGLSKEMIIECIDHRVAEVTEKVLKSHVLESNNMRHFVARCMADLLKGGFEKYQYGKLASFEYLVQEEVRKEVARVIKEQYSFDLKVEPKEKKDV